ncbi:restriction endonuclease subunit S [Photobacterium damselae subsp. damselae]|uniref:restriction endonuclease subunit S n=1 Tax=Photobacterium damselae TaxID=38293 RepID=UPI00311ADDED
MSELPKGWVASSIGEACLIENGLRKPISLKERASCQGHYPYYGATGVIDYLNNYTHEGEYVLIGEDGANLLSKSKPLAFIAKGKYWVNNHAHTLRCLADSPNLYLEKYFNSLSLESWVTGSAQPKLTKKNLESIPYPLAPLNEQKRIVEKLDEVLAQVDTIKARLDGIPAILKRFRQSVLAAAVSGKLTEEWRGSANSFDDWKVLSIGDISTVATGKTPKRTNSEYWNSEDVPWLTSSATGDLFCYEAEQFVSSFGAEDCKLKLFPVGTLLLAMYGEGKTRGQVTELMLEATCNQACAAIIVDENKALKSYVKLRLLENYEETRKAAVGGNQPNLNLNKVREIIIQLPTLEEQKEIVRLVDQYLAFAEIIEAQVKKAQTRVDNLTQSILAKAFRGELVEQDPNDEPADKLLERIAVARKEAEALAKAAKKAQTAKKRTVKKESAQES